LQIHQSSLHAMVSHVLVRAIITRPVFLSSDPESHPLRSGTLYDLLTILAHSHASRLPFVERRVLPLSGPSQILWTDLVDDHATRRHTGVRIIDHERALDLDLDLLNTRVLVDVLGHLRRHPLLDQRGNLTSTAVLGFLSDEVMDDEADHATDLDLSALTYDLRGLLDAHPTAVALPRRRDEGLELPHRHLVERGQVQRTERSDGTHTSDELRREAALRRRLDRASEQTRVLPELESRRGTSFLGVMVEVGLGLAHLIEDLRAG